MADESEDGHTFGTLLRMRRIEAGLTQEHLASRSGLGVRTIRELESERVRRPHRDSVGLLARALRLSLAASDEFARAAGQVSLLREPATLLKPPGIAQLPTAIADFTGRLKYVEELSDLLTGRTAGLATTAVPVCSIIGVGGVGKTALAVHVAHQVRRNFPDGQLFIDLRGADLTPLGAGEALARFLQDLGVARGQVPAEPEERAARFRSIVADRRLLVVLDNARDAEQVRLLLPGGPGCAVIVTSRSHLSGLPLSRLLSLPMLEPAEARALLARIAGRRRTAAEPNATADVLAACAGLPLAIRIAGTRLALRPGWTVSSFAGRLADHHRRLKELNVADLAVRSSFEASYRALPARPSPDTSSRAFRLLGLPAGPDVSIAAASALLGQPEEGAEAALQALVAAQLLDEPSAGRYQLHDLIRSFASERATAEETAGSREQALRRLASWQLNALTRANEMLEPGGRRPGRVPSPGPNMVFASFDAAMQWCEAERDNLLASARQASENGMNDIACQLGIALYTYLDLRGQYQELIAVSRISLASAQVLEDQSREAAALNNIGLAHGELNQSEAATQALARALAINAELGDMAGQAANWGNLGNIHQQEKRYSEALHCFHRTLALSQDVDGSRSYKRTTLVNLGNLYNEMGAFDKAAALCEQTLAICRDDDDRHGEAAAMVVFASACHGLGQVERALAVYRRAVKNNQQIGAPVWRGIALLGYGDILSELGHVQEARTAWQQALASLAELGSAYAKQAHARLSDFRDAGGPGDNSLAAGPADSRCLAA